MKKICTCFLLLFWGLSFTFLIQAQSAAGYTEAQAKLISEFNINGLKVIVKPRPTSPTVAAGLFIRGGVRNYTAENAGIEAFMLDAAVEGSKNFPRQSLRKELSRTGTSITGSADLDYSLISMVSTSQNFERSWEILTDLVLNPTFSNEDVELVRERILTVLRDDKDTPESFLATLEEEKVFAGHPYSKSPIGTLANIQKLKPADLKKHHQSVMQTSQLLLVIVGDVKVDDLQKKITASFGKMSVGNYQETPIPAFNFAKPSLSVTQKELETNYVKGVFPAPSLKDADYFAMKVATTILQSRVYDEVRVARNLSYAPDADMKNLAANTGEISVSSTEANQSVLLMLEEIKKLQNSQIREEELSGIVGFFLTTYYVKQETNAAQAGELAHYELNGGGWRNSLKFLEGIKQVKPQDIQRVSAKYMKNLQFIYLGDSMLVNKSVFLKQ